MFHRFQRIPRTPSSNRRTRVVGGFLIALIVATSVLFYATIGLPAPHSKDSENAGVTDSEKAAACREAGRQLLCEESSQGMEAVLKGAWLYQYTTGVIPPLDGLTQPVSLLSTGTEKGSGSRKLFDVVYNPVRGSKRTSANWAAAPPLALPFSGAAFSFHQVPAAEALLLYRTAKFSSLRPSGACSCAGVRRNPAEKALAAPEVVAGRCQHAAVANKSPLSPYSGLFLPFAAANRSQALVEEDSLEAALAFFKSLSGATRMYRHRSKSAVEGAPTIRLGFNSLAAGASVNHLHFQFWQHPAESIPGSEIPRASQKQRQVPSLPVEATVKRVVSRHDVHPGFALHDFAHFQVPGFCFSDALEHVEEVAEAVARAVRYMTSHEIPYNMLVNPSTPPRCDVYLVPRKPTSAASMLRGVLPAGFPEIMGEVIVPDGAASHWKNLTGDELERHFADNVRQADEVLDAVRNVLTDSSLWSPVPA
ncbi:GDP-L-galactose phosphorylase 1 [Diplonema papillatum]|nr:GDP-L-galactose phosphorylase 1 [Diplonema papillatum]